MKQKAICVLGMHRSGTSCLTGSLETAGVFMGNISFWNTHNVKGNREHHEIVALNNKLLIDNGASWDQPLEPILWAAEHCQERDRILLEFKDAPIWGFKDPRSVLTYEGWQEGVADLQFTGTFRHPAAVAASLKKRSKMPLEKSLQLWLFYNQRILQEHRRKAFPLICFDLAPAALLERFTALFAHLGLATPSDQSVFFDEELKHFSASASEPLPAEVEAVYAELCSVAF